MSEIQRFVFVKRGIEPGDYGFLATQIENNFLPGNLAALLDYDIPASALRKIQRVADPSKSPEEILVRIRGLDLRKLNLIPYEEKKLSSILG